ncbi:MAG: GIY-YIG nuclease family protein [Bacteroidaceae bacterium]|nr:GIY-YIG nuclease family protein [Bacteroidaceae bacterium]
MANENFFPGRPAVEPKIYAYSDSNPACAGMLKVGYTTRDVQRRVAEQYPVLRPGERPYRIVFEETAMRTDGTAFTDHDVHHYLRRHGVSNPSGEWFACDVETVKAAVWAVRNRTEADNRRTETFAMRPEQERIVAATADYFSRDHDGRTPHFLWNCKMRFGKTFATYQLARRMGWKHLLILTFKPAVESAWEEDLMRHVDFEGWQFVSSTTDLRGEDADPNRPIVCFGSFQDYLGRSRSGGIKPKNEWVHLKNWDCVVLDEYHYGAWRELAKDLFVRDEDDQAFDDYDEDMMPITTGAYLYLSGTPFRAIASGEFIEEQIENWTYGMEQKAKEEWQGSDNPYAAMPRMVMMTYQMPDDITEVAKEGEFDEFDLNVFFSAKGEGDAAEFVYKDYVQKWLNLIRGAHHPQVAESLKLRDERPPLPFSDMRLLPVLNHTVWFLPGVASCFAMRNLLAERQNTFYKDYTVIVAAGAQAGMGAEALKPVLEAMGDPLKTKTITLTCTKLMTGVTVKPWTGILMLRNLKTPETYFQAAFRVQSPWTVSNPDGEHPNHVEIMKRECYVFDFAPDRALRQIADYSCRLDIGETDPERKVAEFIKFLPVLAYDGSSMKSIDAAGILDMAMSGTSATLLARRWESALLVNVDNTTLQRLMSNNQAMEALMRIEGFRNLNQDIETIINKSEHVKKVKREAGDDITKSEKKTLTEEEKEYRSKRKQIQDKLIKFATRVPVFMYLTDYREKCLTDVITQLEPGLFKKVTGLDVKDFDLLVSLGVFNYKMMNDAIYKFKRYEDASLTYTGLDKHDQDTSVGGFDTTITRQEFYNLQG